MHTCTYTLFSQLNVNLLQNIKYIFSIIFTFIFCLSISTHLLLNSLHTFLLFYSPFFPVPSPSNSCSILFSQLFPSVNFVLDLVSWSWVMESLSVSDAELWISVIIFYFIYGLFNDAFSVTQIIFLLFL